MKKYDYIVIREQAQYDICNTLDYYGRDGYRLVTCHTFYPNEDKRKPMRVMFYLEREIEEGEE